MTPKRTLRFLLAALAVAFFFSGAAAAQLPPEAVLLDKVKIPQKIQSDELCPISLQPADPNAPTWSYEGVTYRGHDAATQAAFDKDPAKFAAAHKRELYVLNFMEAMSTIWCPITDEVTPGGRKQVDGLGYTWESCCSFCDEEMDPANFDEAFEQLRERAELSYELTGGVYTEGASSPVEGAIDENV